MTESPRVPALVALGANLGDPRSTLRWAHARLGELGTVERVSRLYRTAPVGGPPGQPDYLNAVVRLDTTLPPRDLLRALLAIEHEAGRVRRERWGPRTLDLDLLAHGDTVLDTPELTLPHPRLASRAFVLAPLADVAPSWRPRPDGPTVLELLARLDREGVVPTDEPWTQDGPFR